MNIAFKPNIPEFFVSSTASTTKPDIKKATKPYVTKKVEHKPWLTKELASLVELRALAMPYQDIGLLLKRGSGDCSSAVYAHELQMAIRSKRKLLIEAAASQTLIRSQQCNNLNPSINTTATVILACGLSKSPMITT